MLCSTDQSCWFSLMGIASFCAEEQNWFGSISSLIGREKMEFACFQMPIAQCQSTPLVHLRSSQVFLALSSPQFPR